MAAPTGCSYEVRWWEEPLSLLLRKSQLPLGRGAKGCGRAMLAPTGCSYEVRWWEEPLILLLRKSQLPLGRGARQVTI